jgi:hypothetical protein
VYFSTPFSIPLKSVLSPEYNHALCAHNDVNCSSHLAQAAMATEQYQIYIKSHLDEQWSIWFEDMTICKTFDAKGEPMTSITGSIVDQVALCGVLRRVCDLGMTLISVQPYSGTDLGNSNREEPNTHIS